MSPAAASPNPASPAANVFGSTGTTTIVVVMALVAIGLAMVALSVWLVRATRADPSSLGPLEVMGERRWRTSPADARLAALAEARPVGAPPPSPVIDVEPVGAQPEPDVGDPAGTSAAAAEADSEGMPDESSGDPPAGVPAAESPAPTDGAEGTVTTTETDANLRTPTGRGVVARLRRLVARARR